MTLVETKLKEKETDLSPRKVLASFLTGFFANEGLDPYEISFSVESSQEDKDGTEHITRKPVILRKVKSLEIAREKDTATFLMRGDIPFGGTRPDSYYVSFQLQDYGDGEGFYHTITIQAVPDPSTFENQKRWREEPETSELSIRLEARGQASLSLKGEDSLLRKLFESI